MRLALGYKLYRHQLAELRGVALIALANELLLRFLRAFNPVDDHTTDLVRVLHFRTEWHDLSWRMDELVEELTRRAEAGHEPEEIEQALAAAEG